MSRKRGRLILVGVVGLEISRADFYAKELTFQVSCSYGPGRYDERYEQRGQDYPLGFVRWTEQRNFQAVLNLMTEGRLDVAPLISRRVPQQQAAEAYRLLTEDHTTLGVLLTYPTSSPDPKRTLQFSPAARSRETGGATVALIGAGSYASLVLLPAIARTPAHLKMIASATGASAAHAARRFGFQQATSDYRAALEDPSINTVFIATRHDSHARMVVEALQAGKHVFVEKPLALSREELSAVKTALEQSDGCQLMVGFNRRFAPLAITMRSLLAQRSQPLSLIYTVNAGAIPPDHWTQDPQVGGGRIIGEACHFVDLLRFLAGQPIVGLEARMMGDVVEVVVRQDKMTIALEFADGSVGIVHYLANGSKRYPKERIEVFGDERVLVLDNFRTLRAHGWRGFARRRLWRQDKGHRAEIAAFVRRVTEGGPSLIPWSVLEEVTLASFAAVERAAELPRPVLPLE